MKRFLLCVACVCCLQFLENEVHAQEVTVEQLKSQMTQMQLEFKKMQETYASAIDEMQKKIEILESENDTAQVESYEAQLGALRKQVDEMAAREPESSGLQKWMSKLNPDISVMGDFVYKSTDEDGGEGDNRFNFRETEIAFSANVDSYARGDFYVAIENEDGETEVALEEGYLTLLQTPVDNLQGKFGKFRPNFGKANKLHLHNLPWVDYPKAVQTFLGEEGFSEAGASLNYLLPDLGNIYSEVSLEVINNNDALVFGGAESSEAVYLTHLKNFAELNDQLSLELGGSHMFGENDSGDGSASQLSGVDLTLKWQSDDPGSYKKLSWMTEGLFHRKDQIDEDDIDTWGMYTALEHRFAKRWSAFTRFDFTDEILDNDADTKSYSAGLTFAQSEYAFWRVQYTHDDNDADAEDNNTVWLQLDFGIGPHRAHQY